MMADLRPPIVTDADRQWAIEQCPPWATRSTTESPHHDVEAISDETARERAPRPKVGAVTLDWNWFVHDQAARFERYFCHERKTYGDWSRLWRLSWWPKANPALINRKYGPAAKQSHPFVRRGEPGYDLAMALGTKSERALFQRIGVVQFAPDDPRAEIIRNAAGHRRTM